MLEIALTFALNGFEVHMVDLEGSGFSSHQRCQSVTLELQHHQIRLLLSKIRADLPCFIFAEGYSSLALNSFLDLNKDVKDKIAGVIYSAPVFGLLQKKGIFESALNTFLVLLGMDNPLFIKSVLYSELSGNKQFIRNL